MKPDSTHVVNALDLKTFFLYVLIFLHLVTGCTRQQASPPLRHNNLSHASGSVQFTDVTTPAGIKFTHNNGVCGLKLLPETMGSGVAFIDYDGDGYQDIFLVNSRDWTDVEIESYKHGTGHKYANLVPLHRPRHHSTCLLLHNNKNGTFSDVTRAAGLNVEMYGMGAAVGDYDNDGKPDLFVTGWGRNYLFHNETTKDKPKFRDVTTEAGLQDTGWSTSAAWVDYDRDGKLDLFVCHYMQWTPATDIYTSFDTKHKSYTPPEFGTGQASRLYHNVGRGKFADVSDKAGISKQPQTALQPARTLQGKSLGVAACDYNQDSWPDIVVANDEVPNYLFRNNKNGTFTEVGVQAGIAYGANGTARGGMGVDTADLDHSGQESILVGNFFGQMLGLYQKQGNLFTDIAPRSPVGQDSLAFLTFGCTFLDYDNDGWLDILAANGHVDEIWAQRSENGHYAERPLLFHNVGQGRFQEVGLHSGTALAQPLVARGLAYADIDLDGDLDVLLTTNGGAPHLLRNDGGNHNHALRLVLQGTKSNRSAIGATVEVKVGQETLRRMVRSGSSYLSQSELPLTFGLGQHTQAEAITIHWPAGDVTHLKDIPANQILFITEAQVIVKRLPLNATSK
ncbi:MAG: CRTAC1 family protein [Abitibacteriaceae bacterium]|nr:CRTAC1 family protein [Abditibacteriaceae bacterium]